jgi:uroporphyrinogen decarboxylase
MTPRERVLATYNHREPDRVPICIGGTAQKLAKPLYEQVKARLGITERFAAEDELDELGNTINYSPAFLDSLGSDFRHLQVRRLPPTPVGDGVTLHELGFQLKQQGKDGMVNIVSHPMAEASREDLARFPWPDPGDPRRHAGMREEARRLREGSVRAVALYKATLLGIFDLSCQLRGMDNFLVDLMVDEAFAENLLDDALRFTHGVYDAVLREVGDFVDVVEFNDDLGTQENLIISPEIYRKLLKPRHRALVGLLRARAPKAKVFMHCCGAIRDIIPDLIEIGVDILNPVQPLAAGMDPARLKADFGRDLVFQGGIDLQKAMRGSRGEVEVEVRSRIEQLAPGGGYVLSTANNIGADVSAENVISLFELAREYGKYPVGPGRHLP